MGAGWVSGGDRLSVYFADMQELSVPNLMKLELNVFYRTSSLPFTIVPRETSVFRIFHPEHL
jgi:hypothetical protein